MYQIESVFIGESQTGGEALIKTEVQTEIINGFRVGDVTRMAPNQFTLNCVQCSQNFQHFPEFTLHIEEHFMQGDVFISSSTSADDSSTKNVVQSKEIVADEQLVKIDYNDENEPMEIVGDDIEYDNSFIDIDKTEPETMVEYRGKDGDNRIPADTAEEFDSVLDLAQFVEGVTYKKIDTGFKCMVCGFKSAMKNNLKSHFSAHIKIKKFHCSICIKGFSSIHYVQKHIKSIHKQTISADDIRKAQNTLKQIVKPKKSDRNGNQPDEMSKMKLNVLSSNYWRTEGKNFHCPFCVQWFCKPKYVQKHIRLVHGQNCKLDDILAAQIQPELKPEPTKSVEMVTQNQIKSLQREQTKDTGKRAKSFECFVCHTKFVSEKALRYHMPLHSGIQYRCPLCEKYFSMQKYVRDHMIYKHGFDKKSKLPPLRTRKIENFEYHKPKVSRFECYMDHRTYPSRSKLNSHMKCHLDVLECIICMKIFKSTESRRSHMQLHSADPNLLHCCPVCNKGFSVRRYMMSHMRTTHRSPKIKAEKPPKICSEPKSFVEGEDYIKSDDKFECLTCSRKMVKWNHMNEHLLTHTNEKNVLCPICARAFLTESYVRKHVNRTHNQKITTEEIKAAQPGIDVSQTWA